MMSIRFGRVAASAILCLALAVSVQAANKKKPPPPRPTTPVPTDEQLGFYENTRAQTLARVKRVGIVTATLPFQFDDREAAKQQLQDAVAKYLRLAGMDVVGSASYQAAFDRLNAQAGGIYDPKTGEVREEVGAAVFQGALREFMSKERLDGYVHIRVQARSADYSSFYAFWDGVIESSNGKPVPNSVGQFFAPSGSSGLLPALSLIVQIEDAQGRIVFGRAGGIQPISYIKFQSGRGFYFVDVAVKDLLRDEARFDRAAKVATLPLIQTPYEIWLADNDPAIDEEMVDLNALAELPPPASTDRVSPLLVPRDQILGKVRRVALSPLDTAGFDVPDAVQQRLRELVRQELAPLNWEIVDSPEAREVLRTKLRESSLFDPLTGKRDEARASAVRKSVFPLLGAGNPPDATLWIALVRTTAQHRKGDVEWDGVDQSGFTMGPVVRSLFKGSAVEGSGAGGIKAISLQAFLVDAEDNHLYRGRGGLQLTQKLKLTLAPYGSYQPNITDAIDLGASELFLDPAREKPAVHVTLRDLSLTPEALLAEIGPGPSVKKGAKKKTRK